MYVASVKARKVHNDFCPYCIKIKKENKKEYFHMDEGINEGYVLCQHCSATKKKILDQKEFIDEVAKRRKLEYELKDGMMVIDDGLYKWKVYYSKQYKRLVVYHQNYIEGFDENDNSPISGYHLQNIELRKLTDVLVYIDDHFTKYLYNERIPSELRHKAEDRFYERKHKKPRKKNRDIKQERSIAKQKAVENVFCLMELIKTDNG